MKLLNSMASKISEIGSALAAITHDVRTLQRVAPPEQSLAARVNLRPTNSSTDVSHHSQFRSAEEFPRITDSVSQHTSVAIDSVVACTAEPISTPSWAAMTSSPFAGENRFALLTIETRVNRSLLSVRETSADNDHLHNDRRSSSSNHRHQPAVSRNRQPRAVVRRRFSANLRQG